MAVLWVILILGVLAAAGVLVWKRRQAPRREPSCGKCGYLVKGLPTFTCPECGSDLREVGIVTQETRRPMSAGVKAITWTIALPLPAFLLTSLIANALPFVQSTTDTLTYQPASGAYAQIVLTGTYKGPPAGYPPAQMLAFRLAFNPAMAGQAVSSDLSVDTATWGYGYVGKDGRKVAVPGGLDARVIRDWMLSAGAASGNTTTQSAAIQEEAAELLAQAQAMGNGRPAVPMPAFSTSSRSAGGSMGPPVWPIVTLSVFWLLLWLLGFWWIMGSWTRRGAAGD